MTKPIPLCPGDKIKFVGWARVDGYEECNYFAEFPTRAVVDLLVMGSPDSIRIKYGNDIQGLIHRRQVTHVIRKKAKQETERVELYAAPEEARRAANIPDMEGTLGVPCCGVPANSGRDSPFLHLVEVRPGERVVSRADMAKAWDSFMNHSDLNSKVSPAFAKLCTALGLGLSKEGGK